MVTGPPVHGAGAGRPGPPGPTPGTVPILPPGRAPRRPAPALLVFAGVLLAGGAAALARRESGPAVLVLAASAVALGAGSLAAALLARRLVVVTVTGISMEPTYRHGDRVLVRRGGTPMPGQVVVVERPPSGIRHRRRGGPAAGPGGVPGRQWMIKRVAAVPGDPVPRERVPALGDVPEDRIPPGKLVLLGDNPHASLDSRRIGYFPAERVLGAVLRPLSR